ncbi:SPOR domain-containing protein [Rubrivirga sp. IMCC45206]|uniref:SPOR domain-containing protein n=1 Tax=Rubrivirga sp. IMCC45206 TaxID=3391614 RepID=UPI0039902C3B
MTPLDAVAAALRERLLAGRPAPLPGLGTLVRQHVPSRVEERPDGTRVLLPPGETIGLGPADAGADSLAQPFAAFSGIPADRADAAYAQAMDQIEAVLSATGEVRLVGVGLLRRTSGGVVLGVEADLLAAVNRRYEGLTPVATPTAAPGPAAMRPAPPSVARPAQEPAPTEAPDREPTAPAASESTAPPAASPLDAAFETDADGVDAPLPDAEPADGPVATGPPVPDQPTEPPSASDDPRAAPLSAPPSADGPHAATDLDRAEAPAPDGPDGDPTETPLAVPFGGPEAPPLPEVLPPTPTEADEDWGDDTWAAPAVTGAAADLGTELPIEDADFDVVVPGLDEPEDLAPGIDAFTHTFGQPVTAPDGSPEPPAPPAEVVGSLDDAPATPRAPGEPAAAPPVPIETVGPPVGSGPPTAAPLADPDRAPEPATRRVWPWALLVLLVLAAVAAVAFWDQIATLVDRPAPGQTYTASAGGASSTDASTAPAFAVPEDPDPADSLVGAGLPPSPTPDGAARSDESRPGGTAEVAEPAPPAETASPRPQPAPSRPAPRADDDGDASIQPALGRAPAAGLAMLPPRLAGLDVRDVNALSGPDEIAPRAGGYSFVVLSTPALAEAERLAVRWRRAGYRTSVLTADVGGRSMYRVVIGQFSSRDQALRLRDRIGPQAPADTWLLDLRTL